MLNVAVGEMFGEEFEGVMKAHNGVVAAVEAMISYWLSE